MTKVCQGLDVFVDVLSMGRQKVTLAIGIPDAVMIA
jgi:hypothetical protein